MNLEKLEQESLALSKAIDEVKACQDKKKKLVIQMTQCDMALKQAELTLKKVQQNMGISTAKQKSTRVPKKDAMRLVVEVMRTNKERHFRVSEIIQMTGLSRGPVSGALKELTSKDSPVKKYTGNHKVNTRYSWNKTYSG